MTKKQIKIFGEIAAATYNTPTMRKIIRAQLAATIFPSTNIGNSGVDRINESLEIADYFLKRAGLEK